MRVEVWTLPNCPRCEKAKAELASAGLAFEERSLDALRRGDIRDVEALAALAMADYQAPIVRMDGRFVERHELLTLMAGCGSQCQVEGVGGRA